MRKIIFFNVLGILFIQASSLYADDNKVTKEINSSRKEVSQTIQNITQPTLSSKTCATNGADSKSIDLRMEIQSFNKNIKIEDKKTYVTYTAYQKEQAIRTLEGDQDPFITAPPESLFHTRFHPR